MADETTTTESTTTETTATETKGADTTASETKGTEATTETKAAETTETKSGEETKGTETKAETPADYSKLTLPEGYKADDPVFGEAVKLFGTEKIAPEVAQKLIDFTVERDKQIAKAVNDSAAANWAKQTTEWKENAAKEFSAEALGDAKTALAQVFDKETVTYLESMGFTNHPGLIRGMVKVSKAIKDDSWVTGNAGAGGARDARSQFPNSNMNP
ncbi:hypothetical protein [Reyranella sp.]|uniref:hypothetical protein n=1 Tax=Reyranella sp. TaxID=1929291 RepID=UPI0025F34039|nr:hypothetical protein [Reyranella sp.]